MRGMATARKRAGSRLSVAVLYSGRFYGELTLPAWSKDHLDNLIVPNGAAVFVVVDPVKNSHWLNRANARGSCGGRISRNSRPRNCRGGNVIAKGNRLT